MHASTTPSPSSSAALQSISIPRSENRSSGIGSSYTVYAIVVRLPVRSWTVYRRYSEFLALHQNLSGLGSSSSGAVVGPPPAPFPPKHVARKTMRAVTGFGSLFGSSAAGDEEMVQERKSALETYLRAILTSSDDKWREAEAFREFLELPTNVHLAGGGGGGSVAAGRGVGNISGSATSTSSIAQKYISNGGSVPGAYVPPSASSSMATTRQLGARPPAAETETTRPMSDEELLNSQQQQFDKQDATLNDLAAILRRQRQMGLAINHELLEQNELLDELDTEVQNVQGKMNKNEKQIKRLG